jgi:hypothetical protein
MTNIVAGKRFPSTVAWAPPLNFAGALHRLGKRLRRKSRQEAQAEAVVNRFGCDRWSDEIEREISARVR